jgi:hypothetical protein
VLSESREKIMKYSKLMSNQPCFEVPEYQTKIVTDKVKKTSLFSNKQS